jgi:hypothetical protein
MKISDSSFNQALTDVTEMTVRVLTKEPTTDYALTVFLADHDGLGGICVLTEGEQEELRRNVRKAGGGLTVKDLLLGFGKKLSEEMPPPAAAFVAGHAGVVVSAKPGVPAKESVQRDECIFVWGCCCDGRTNGADIPVGRGYSGEFVPHSPKYLYFPSRQGAVDLNNNLAATLLEGFGVQVAPPPRSR